MGSVMSKATVKVYKGFISGTVGEYDNPVIAKADVVQQHNSNMIPGEELRESKNTRFLWKLEWDGTNNETGYYYCEWNDTTPPADS